MTFVFWTVILCLLALYLTGLRHHRAVRRAEQALTEEVQSYLRRMRGEK